jgi:predicted ribosomally synthesized peptide with nif11-like leader
MSITAVEEFLTHVGQDPALQTELTQALDADNDREAVTALAQSKGYSFSPDELWAEVQKRQADFKSDPPTEDLELSDEELESVAGGELLVIAVLSAAGALASAGFAISRSIGDKIKW